MGHPTLKRSDFGKLRDDKRASGTLHPCGSGINPTTPQYSFDQAEQPAPTSNPRLDAEEGQEMSDIDNTRMIERQRNALTRRDLIKGVIVGGVAVSSAGYLFRASTLVGQSVRGTGERLLTINVNGQMRRADVMRQETLDWTLRHQPGATGTTLHCNRAECGSSTVLVYGLPHYSGSL